MFIYLISRELFPAVFVQNTCPGPHSGVGLVGQYVGLLCRINVGDVAFRRVFLRYKGERQTRDTVMHEELNKQTII